MIPEPPGPVSKVESIRQTIATFLNERLQAKLDKTKNEESETREKLVAAHQPEAWIADAARRVSQIQQVSHALKYTHPDAKGTNLYSDGNPSAGAMRIGTHTLPTRTPDVVGNAAALDVNKFLRLEVEGKTLLTLALENDSDLSAALSSSPKQAQLWMTSFAAVTSAPDTPASHKLAKQIYWPLGNNEYHLLSPLFPTSLVHQLWTEIRDARFSEEAKAAREARFNNREHSTGYREYAGLVIQKFGGTKPQNISQLNSERYGENYLFSSVPPVWKTDKNRPPLKTESIFDGWFPYRARVKDLTQSLREFLYRVQDYNNMHIRETRASFIENIIDELLAAAAELRENEESWTLHADCRLSVHEQLWLNPSRCQFDEEFSKLYNRGDWKDLVCKRFANWLNTAINDAKYPLALGESEASFWKRDLEHTLSMLRLEVDQYE